MPRQTFGKGRQSARKADAATAHGSRAAAAAAMQGIKDALTPRYRAPNGKTKKSAVPAMKETAAQTTKRDDRSLSVPADRPIKRSSARSPELQVDEKLSSRRKIVEEEKTPEDNVSLVIPSIELSANATKAVPKPRGRIGRPPKVKSAVASKSLTGRDTVVVNTDEAHDKTGSISTSKKKKKRVDGRKDPIRIAARIKKAMETKLAKKAKKEAAKRKISKPMQGPAETSNTFGTDTANSSKIANSQEDDGTDPKSNKHETPDASCSDATSMALVVESKAAAMKITLPPPNEERSKKRSRAASEVPIGTPAKAARLTDAVDGPARNIRASSVTSTGPSRFNRAESFKGSKSTKAVLL